MVTPAAAKIARPAGLARLLPVHMSGGEPLGLARAVDAVLERAHGAVLVADEAVTGGQFAVRRHAKIARAGAARVGPMRAAVDFPHRVDHIGERIALSKLRAALVFASTVDHLAQHQL